MPPTTTLRRATLAALAAALCGLTAVPASAPAQGTGPCANADIKPAADNIATVEQATLCLINVQRTHHHLARLRSKRSLHAVARRYARRMVAQRFFDHVSPGGGTFVQRIRHSSYLGHASGYALGENLAWGAGPVSTPREIVRMWMHSPGHRANILNPMFADTGLGVAFGTPDGGSDGGTYAEEFGKRL